MKYGGIGENCRSYSNGMVVATLSIVKTVKKYDLSNVTAHNTFDNTLAFHIFFFKNCNIYF